MATSWISGIRRRGQLAIYAGSSLRGIWVNVFREALREFNALARATGSA